MEGYEKNPCLDQAMEYSSAIGTMLTSELASAAVRSAEYIDSVSDELMAKVGDVDDRVDEAMSKLVDVSSMAMDIRNRVHGLREDMDVIMEDVQEVRREVTRVEGLVGNVALSMALLRSG